MIRLLIAAAIVLGAHCPAQAQDRRAAFGAAGVPRDLGESRDYERIFTELAANGVTVFYPTFQYVEQPEPKSLGFESDFLPPCRPDQPSFAAMRKHKIRLIVLGSALFPADAPLANGAMLKALIDCAGRENVEGVMSYDEPAHQNVPVAASKRLYEAVKAVDRTLPVMMVHAPFVMDRGDLQTPEGRKSYLRAIAEHSRYADAVGFDVYPIPKDLAQVGSPISPDRGIVDHRVAIRDHAAWLARNFAGKRRFMVLQAFSYADQYAPSALTALAGSPLFDIVRPPTAGELGDMARGSVEGGATLVVWWGQSFLTQSGGRVWRDVLATTKQMAAPPK